MSNEGIDTIDTVEEMKMENVDINTVAHLYPHQVSPYVFKRKREVKKSYVLQHPFTNPTKKKKMLMSKFSKPSIAFDLLRLPSSKALTTFIEYFSKNDEAVLVDYNNDYNNLKKKNFFCICIHFTIV